MPFVLELFMAHGCVDGVGGSGGSDGAAVAVFVHSLNHNFLSKPPHPYLAINL